MVPIILFINYKFIFIEFLVSNRHNKISQSLIIKDMETMTTNTHENHIHPSGHVHGDRVERLPNRHKLYVIIINKSRRKCNFIMLVTAPWWSKHQLGLG